MKTYSVVRFERIGSNWKAVERATGLDEKQIVAQVKRWGKAHGCSGEGIAHPHPCLFPYTHCDGGVCVSISEEEK